MPGKLKVIAKSTEGSQMIEGEYNTVRHFCIFVHMVGKSRV